MNRESEVARWLRRFANCVRRVDYEAGAGLFSPAVLGFGTHAGRVNGRDALVARQWSHIWPNTADMAFEVEQQVLHFASDDRLVCVAVPFTSTGFDPWGRPFHRPGRATLVLERDEGGPWLCRHSHFSLLPGTPEFTRRPPAYSETPGGRGSGDASRGDSREALANTT